MFDKSEVKNRGQRKSSRVIVCKDKKNKDNRQILSLRHSPTQLKYPVLGAMVAASFLPGCSSPVAALVGLLFELLAASSARDDSDNFETKNTFRDHENFYDKYNKIEETQTYHYLPACITSLLANPSTQLQQFYHYSKHLNLTKRCYF